MAQRSALMQEIGPAPKRKTKVQQQRDLNMEATRAEIKNAALLRKKTILEIKVLKTKIQKDRMKMKWMEKSMVKMDQEM